MRDLFLWMNETPWSIGLRESFYLWPAIELTHVMSLTLFFGTIVMVDLRLLGLAFKDIPVSRFDKRILPWTMGGFALLVVTGVILVYSKPMTYYESFFLRTKLLVILGALINIGVFHFLIQKNQDEWDASPVPASGARVSALVSLTAWVIVIVLGRFIAYDWMHCGKFQPGTFLHGYSGCPIYETSNAGGLE